MLRSPLTDGPYKFSFGHFNPKSSTKTKDRCPTHTPDECDGCREEIILQTKVGIKNLYVKEVKLITGCYRGVIGYYKGLTGCCRGVTGCS